MVLFLLSNSNKSVTTDLILIFIYFQSEVEVGGQWFLGEDSCASKKDSEQSAAKMAMNALLREETDSIVFPSLSELSPVERQSEMPLSYAEVVTMDSSSHLPEKYADPEHFIAMKVGSTGGRIRRISKIDQKGRYRFEITDAYRYCENIQDNHDKNCIHFIVDSIEKTFVQRCDDPGCDGYQSAIKSMINTTTNSARKCSHCQKKPKHNRYDRCERCGRDFCNQCLFICELCHDAVHCERCFECCFDCHDS